MNFIYFSMKKNIHREHLKKLFEAIKIQYLKIGKIMNAEFLYKILIACTI